jgi:large subunit ribosomal protein L17
MFRNMLVSLIQHERIRTTLAKGKELRIWADKIITLAKENTLHARRQAFARLRNETIVKKLFDEIAPKMKEREGGYTRIYKMGWRQGDGAPLSLVELVTFVHKEEKQKSTVEKAKEVFGKVTPKKKEKKAEEKGKEKTEKKPKKAEKEAPKEKKEKPKKKPKKEE